MQALILAAGFGRRMRPLTDHRHKTLLPISGSTIIDRILTGLAERNVSPITVVTGYRANELREHIAREHPDLDVRYVHNAVYETTNNIHSMALAFEHLDLGQDVVLIESDLIYDAAILDRLLSAGQPNVALVDRFRPGMDGTVVTLGADGLITQVIPPSLQGSDFSFADKFKTLNIYRFSSDFCRSTLRKLLTYYAKTFDDNCYYELILGILIYMQQAEIHALVVDDHPWAEVDDPNDLRIAEFTFNPGTRYDALTEGWGGNWSNDVTDFAFIRNMYFPTPAMLSELRENLPAVLHNYGSRQAVLDEKLAWAMQWPAPTVHAIAGASQCYPWLRTWFAGRRVAIPSPTFGEYSRIFPDAVHWGDVPGQTGASFEDVAGDADVTVFVNPNNPTGTVFDTAAIAEFAQRHPEQTVVVDESFIDFSDQPSIVGRLVADRLDNVLVIKSLSKGLGVPGLRLGALVTTNADLSRQIVDETPIWNLNSLAENFLEVMLKNRPELEQSYRRTAEDRDQFALQLKASPLVDTVFPSGANFLLVRLSVEAHSADQLARRLVERHAVLVKDASPKVGDGRGYWRLAVRTPDEHAAFVGILAELKAVT